MTDREMLELAAKAIGCDGAKFEDGEWLELRYGYKVAMWHDDFDSYWNPLESNANAFALAVKLGLDLLRTEQDIEAIAGLPPYAPMGRDVPAPFGIELLGDDAYAATRRAITRAAAEIGKGMP
ncbi:MAG TPA: hypothetical protein VJ846_14135 [Sphingomicrobium sp.]|nr:hypothetical protein [Sphingomicrobium sp.]